MQQMSSIINVIDVEKSQGNYQVDVGKEEPSSICLISAVLMFSICSFDKYVIRKQYTILLQMATETNHVAILKLSDGNTFLDAFMQIASLPLGE